MNKEKIYKITVITDKEGNLKTEGVHGEMIGKKVSVYYLQEGSSAILPILNSGKHLRTSTVQEIRGNKVSVDEEVIIITTRNTIYNLLEVSEIENK